MTKLLSMIFSLFIIQSTFALSQKLDCGPTKHVIKSKGSAEVSCAPRPKCNPRTTKMYCYETKYGTSCVCKPLDPGRHLKCPKGQSITQVGERYKCRRRPKCNPKTEELKCWKFNNYSEACNCIAKKDMERGRDSDLRTSGSGRYSSCPMDKMDWNKRCVSWGAKMNCLVPPCPMSKRTIFDTKFCQETKSVCGKEVSKKGLGSCGDLSFCYFDNEFDKSMIKCPWGDYYTSGKVSDKKRQDAKKPRSPKKGLNESSNQER